MRRFERRHPDGPSRDALGPRSRRGGPSGPPSGCRSALSNISRRLRTPGNRAPRRHPIFRPAMRSDARSNASRGSVAERGAPPSRPAPSAPPPRVEFGLCDAFDVLTLSGILERIAVRNIGCHRLFRDLGSKPLLEQAASWLHFPLTSHFELRTSNFSRRPRSGPPQSARTRFPRSAAR